MSIKKTNETNSPSPSATRNPSQRKETNSHAELTHKENKMGTMPVNKLLITMALPIMLSMLVQALYNIVDSIFVSRISEEALTAVSMAFPMQNLMIGLASGLGVGTNALVSRFLGEKKPERASQTAMHGVLLALCAYAVFLILGLTIARWFFVIQGAKPEIADFGQDYLSIVMCFSFGIFGQIIFERLLQSTGKTIYTMITQGIGAIINIILDPILIFGLLGMPKMGISGAGYATIIGQILAAMLALLFNMLINKELHFSIKKFQFQFSIIRQILYIGIPSVIMVAIGSVMTFCIDKILVVFSSTAVAVFGVYFKLQSFAFMPLFGMNNAMIPIVAYNYGAKKPERLLKTVKLSMLYAEGIMCLALLAVQLFPQDMLLLFDASEQMLRIGIPALRIITTSFVFAGICIIASSFFQAMGNGMYSTIVSFLRQLVFLVPLAFLFSKTGNIDMVWVAWPLAEIVSIFFSCLFLRKIYKKTLKPMLKH